eukprot:scaffold6377_cov80-Phaeocystis_antarctica.AAC.2
MGPNADTVHAPRPVAVHTTSHRVPSSRVWGHVSTRKRWRQRLCRPPVMAALPAASPVWRRVAKRMIK